MKNSNVILGVLGGLAIGAIAGILFAPDKGTKTRKKIKAKAKDVKANFENDFENFMSKMEEK
jgi:gas vesicle protein